MPKAVDVLIGLAAVVAIIGGLVNIRAAANRRQQPPVVPLPRVGETAKELKSFTAKTAEATVILAISGRCHFCWEQTPFYRRVVESAGSKKPSVAVVIVTSQSRSDAAAIVTAIGGPVAVMPDQDFRALKISATPTVVVLDPNGRTLFSRIGRLEEREQVALLDIVRGG